MSVTVSRTWAKPSLLMRAMAGRYPGRRSPITRAASPGQGRVPLFLGVAGTDSASRAEVAQGPDHELRLLVGVALPVLGVGLGQPGLDRGVPLAQGRVGPERVAEAELQVPPVGPLGHQVQVGSPVPVIG